MKESVNLNDNFDEEVRKQNEALLQIVNNTLKSESDDDDEEFDLEKELEKIKNAKSNKLGGT